MEKLGKHWPQYYVLDTEASYAVNFTVDEQTKDYLWFTLPMTNWSLATLRADSKQDWQPHPIDCLNLQYSSEEFTDKEVDYASWWRCNFVSKRMRSILDQYNAEACYSDAELHRRKPSSTNQKLFVIMPTIAIYAIDRQSSIFEDEPDDPITIRVSRIQRVVLDAELINQEQNTAQFVLAGTSQNIWLVREDLALAIGNANLNGVLIQEIQECSWDY
ncbi:MAG: DUF1629 domain-containing protein [Pseudomonadales bacterium]